MKTGWKYFLFLIWILYLYVSGVLLFSRGFLLNRQVIPEKSKCLDPNVKQYLGSNCLLPRAKRIVIIIVDALKYEFAYYNESITTNNSLPFQNKLPVFSDTRREKPNHTRLYQFIADPPTTTMQRIKGLTTGSLPTFIDISSNFASYEIKEDNFIDQLLAHEQSAVFMGDDTWMGLYPTKFKRAYPFPSFNVWDLDTVDNGILEHLFVEIENDDWNVLVAHFLGVDHCGHRYGPNHPEMSRKLSQMDKIIRNVMSKLPEDTMLLVFGDHGMTRTGDHGGDSEAEVTAALFVYSPHPLIPTRYGPKTGVVAQIDLVPTVSAILGLPVPYSNIGTVVLDSIPAVAYSNNRTILKPSTKSDMLTFTSQILWNNVEQVRNYINKYSERTGQISADKMNPLQDLFLGIESSFEDLRTEKDYERFLKLCRKYLSRVKDICNSVWVKFDLVALSWAIVLVTLAMLFTVIVVETLSMEEFESVVSAKTLALIYGAVFLSGVGSSILTYYDVFEHFDITIFITSGCASIVIALWVVLDNVRRLCNFVQVSAEGVNLTSIFLRIILLVSMLGFFSNSYVIEEASALSFLSATAVWLLFLPMKTVVEATPKVLQRQDKSRFSLISAMRLSHRKMRCFLAVVTFCVVLRLTHYFWRCREEQTWCETAETIHKPMGSALHPRSFRYWVTLVIFAFMVTLFRIWLRTSGNLNGFSPTVLAGRYLPVVIVVATCTHWALRGLPPALRASLTPWQQFVIPKTILVLITILLLTVLFEPNMVYVLHRSTGNFLKDFIPEGQQSVIPVLYKKLKETLQAKQCNGAVGSRPAPLPLVYGLATCYSAPLVLLLLTVVLLATLLLGEGLAPSVVLIVAAVVALIIVTAIVRQDSAIIPADLLHVPWSQVLAWSLLASYSFFATGHQPTLPAIPWEAAFVVTAGEFGGQTLEMIAAAVLVNINTFCGQLLLSCCLPLLLFGPLTLFATAPRVGGPLPHPLSEKINTLKHGEFGAFENEKLLNYSIFNLASKYCLISTLRVFATMIAAAYHRRHLMVWKIFAPRFIFEGISLFITLIGVLVGYFVVLRVSAKLEKLVKELQVQRGVDE